MKSLPVIPIEYAFLQFCHSAYTGERINVGVILATRNGQYSFYHTPDTRALEILYPPFDSDAYQNMRNSLRYKVEALMELYGGAASLEMILSKTGGGCFLWSTTVTGVHPDITVRFEELKAAYVYRRP